MQVTDTDIPFIIKGLQSIRQESRFYSAFPDDPEYVSTYLLALWKAGFFVGARTDHGFMIGCLSRPWTHNAVRLTEMCLFVQPSHRGSLCAARLIKEFEHLAVQHNCTEITAGASSGVLDERLLELYQRLGWERFHTGVIKRIRH